MSMTVHLSEKQGHALHFTLWSTWVSDPANALAVKQEQIPCSPVKKLPLNPEGCHKSRLMPVAFGCTFVNYLKIERRLFMRLSEKSPNLVLTHIVSNVRSLSNQEKIIFMVPSPNDDDALLYLLCVWKGPAGYKMKRYWKPGVATNLREVSEKVCGLRLAN